MKTTYKQSEIDSSFGRLVLQAINSTANIQNSIKEEAGKAGPYSMEPAAVLRLYEAIREDWNILDDALQAFKPIAEQLHREQEAKRKYFEKYGTANE